MSVNKNKVVKDIDIDFREVNRIHIEMVARDMLAVNKDIKRRMDYYDVILEDRKFVKTALAKYPELAKNPEFTAQIERLKAVSIEHDKRLGDLLETKKHLLVKARYYLDKENEFKKEEGILNYFKRKILGDKAKVVEPEKAKAAETVEVRKSRVRRRPRQ